MAAELDRPLDEYGLEYVAVRSPTPADSIEQAERWREAGGTHFSAVSMGDGRDSIEAHLDFYNEVAAGVID
jgi:hypothetical protein